MNSSKHTTLVTLPFSFIHSFIIACFHHSPNWVLHNILQYKTLFDWLIDSFVHSFIHCYLLSPFSIWTQNTGLQLHSAWIHFLFSLSANRNKNSGVPSALILSLTSQTHPAPSKALTLILWFPVWKHLTVLYKLLLTFSISEQSECYQQSRISPKCQFTHSDSLGMCDDGKKKKKEKKDFTFPWWFL